MAWDSSRPVPWRRLTREWLIYVGIMIAVFALFLRDQSLAPIIGGLLVSGPLYLLIGYVLAKFGYQRTSLRNARAAASSRTADRDSAGDAAPGPRPKPAPTRRTGGGTPRKSGGKRR